MRTRAAITRYINVLDMPTEWSSALDTGEYKTAEIPIPATDIPVTIPFFSGGNHFTAGGTVETFAVPIPAPAMMPKVIT